MNKLFKTTLLTNVAKAKSVIVHIGNLKYDQQQASHLPSSVKVLKHKDAETHNLAAHLKQKGTLLSLIETELKQLSVK